MESSEVKIPHAFCDADRQAVYRAIATRRDVRSEFLPQAVPAPVLARLLMAAHHAPSVGFMQPWNFLVVRSAAVKQKVHASFQIANEEAKALFTDSKRELYSSLKLQGILDSPINLAVTCDRSRSGPVVLGRTHMPSMDVYSSVCAVQNLWLAARAEGLGVGWVSIFDESALKEVLGIPADIVLVAYLCIGYVSHFNEQPALEKAGWLPRLAIEELVFQDQWGSTEGEANQELVRDLHTLQGSGDFRNATGLQKQE